MPDSIHLFLTLDASMYLTSAQAMAACSIITGMERLLIQTGGERGEGAAMQLYRTDITVKICFVSADRNGKNKTTLSLLLYLCLVVTWISSKISMQRIYLSHSSHISRAINLS